MPSKIALLISASQQGGCDKICSRESLLVRAASIHSQVVILNPPFTQLTKNMVRLSSGSLIVSLVQLEKNKTLASSSLLTDKIP
jgi:hypothetical protein